MAANRYFATCISGTQDIVRGVLEERLKDLQLLRLLDGAVEFETAVPYSDLNLFCFHNIFRSLHSGELPRGPGVLDAYGAQLLRSGLDWSPVRENPAKSRTFRLVASQENKLVSLKPSLRGALEKKISQVSGLRVDRSRPDTEFWLLARSEGTCRFLKRLSRHTSYDKLLDPGELHPELAYLMCWLSRPKHTDTVVDPFCGYGSIPAQRCKRFPFFKIYAFDNDRRVLDRAREKLGKPRDNLVLECRDALKLSQALPPESVDAVITDPPWGLYRGMELALEEFYRRVFRELDRVL